VGLALAAALVEMVAGLTLRRERYAGVHAEAQAAATRGEAIRTESLALARADALAFAGFERALALPRDTEGQRAERERAKRAAFREGARVQQELLSRSEEIARLALDLVRRGLASAGGDAATALFLAGAAARSAEAAVRGNLAGEPDADARRMTEAAATLLARVEGLEREAKAAGEPG
jgi:formiminotetrahydrofolate cyclodeaminase